MRIEHLNIPLLILVSTVYVMGCSSSNDTDNSVPMQSGFLDDFSADSLRLTADRRAEANVVRSYSVEEDRIVISSTSTNGEQAHASVDAWGRTDSFTARLAFSSESVLPEEEDARATVRITGTFYNDTQDNGFDGKIGDIGANIQLVLRGDGQTETFFCAGREGGGEITFLDGSNCSGFEDFELELDVEYTLSIRLDREAGTLTYSIDQFSRTFDIGGPVFLPANDRHRVQITHEASEGKTVASVYAVGIDAYLQDFVSEKPTIGPYRPFFDLENSDGRLLGVIDDRARFIVPSIVDSDRSMSIQYQGSSDRIQSLVELSSESEIAGELPTEDNTIRIRIGGVFYNDVSDGGANGSEGNVFAIINLRSDPDADAVLEYCAYRSNNSDFSDAVELINENGTDCGDFDISASFDTEYAVSITVDRDSGTLTFVAQGVEKIYNISTTAFAPPEEQFLGLRTSSANGSTAVAFADDFGTSSDAPLVSE